VRGKKLAVVPNLAFEKGLQGRRTMEALQVKIAEDTEAKAVPLLVLQ
jgi:hypothetical protein